MLEPDARHLLLDALRPPSGFALDLAVGTTYSLDLLALMSAPVAFAMFDRQSVDGSPIDDPIAILQALREHADRITLFCQAGQIAVPPEFRSLLVYLEDLVHPVVPPNPEAIFHPKVWYLRFRRVEGDGVAYRLLCLSRNLTFDRSWDTVLRLEGEAGTEVTHPELARFAQSLLSMAEPVRPVATDRALAIRELGYQCSRARWIPPDGFEKIRFWPLGDDGVPRWPFEGRRDRMFVISPFMTRGTLSRLTKNHRGSLVLTRPETFDALGKAATKHLAERLVLSSDAGTTDEDVADLGQFEAAAESAGSRLEGLHAKTYVADAGWRARVWTGSANATDTAFHGNVEFVVELEGRKDRCGVEAVIGARGDRLGLRKLVEPYVPSQEEPLEPGDTERIAQQLDRARRAIGGLRFTATCRAIEADRWILELQGTPTVTAIDSPVLADLSVTVRPVTLDRGLAVRPMVNPTGLSVSFATSESGVTPFFAMTLAISEIEITFLVTAELIDPPPRRAERVLRNLLSNRADLIRFLLLLLGNVDPALAAFSRQADGVAPGGAWLAGLGSEALLEPLIRAFSRDPERLRNIAQVLAEIGRSPEGISILPDRWDEIWDPIAAALIEDSPQ